MFMVGRNTAAKKMRNRYDRNPIRSDVDSEFFTLFVNGRKGFFDLRGGKMSYVQPDMRFSSFFHLGIYGPCDHVSRSQISHRMIPFHKRFSVFVQ